MLIYAHRGEHQNCTENSAAAFESALSLGYRAVELDLRSLVDRTPVVFHDADLRRMCGLNVCLADLKFSEFADLFPEALSLHEFVRNFAARFAVVNFEIKDGLQTYRRLRPYIRDRRRAVVSSFDHDVVDAAIRDNLRAGYLVGQMDQLQSGLPRFLCNRLHLSASLTTQLPADALLWNNFKVHVYTVNQTEAAFDLSRRSFVRGIFTDNSDILQLDRRRRAVAG